MRTNPNRFSSWEANSRPWIIWVQPLRNSTLMLLVLAPQHRRFLSLFGRWRKTVQVHVDGPVHYSSPQEEIDWMQQMIEAGATWVPDDTRYLTAMSLADVYEIVDETWKPKALRRKLSPVT